MAKILLYTVRDRQRDADTPHPANNFHEVARCQAKNATVGTEMSRARGLKVDVVINALTIFLGLGFFILLSYIVWISNKLGW